MIDDLPPCTYSPESELEFVAPALGGPCDGQILRSSAPKVVVPVMEGYTEPDEHGYRRPVFGAATYCRSGGFWVIFSVQHPM